MNDCLCTVVVYVLLSAVLFRFQSSNVREVSSEFYQTPGNVIITSTALDWNSFSQHNLAAGLAATTPPSEVPTSTAKVVATHAKPVAKKKSSIAGNDNTVFVCNPIIVQCRE